MSKMDILILLIKLIFGMSVSDIFIKYDIIVADEKE